MTRQIFKLTALFVFACAVAQAQDPLFSQFYATPLVLNPAFAGTTYSPRISATYRNQWPVHANDGTAAYTTYAASYEQFVPAFNSGIGVMVMSDNSGGGILKTTSFAANYAYRIAVNEDFNIRLGINAGFKQSNIDWDKLVFLDQLDPITGPLDPSGLPNFTNELRPADLSTTIFDVGAGLLAYTNKFYGGISLQHLTTPDEGFFRTNVGLLDGLPLRTSVHAGAEFIVKKGNKHTPSSFVSPNILFAKQGDQGQVNVGAYYNHGLVFFGGWFRHAFGNADALIGLAGVQYDILKIGYSYDFTLGSSVASPTGGAHEISLVINFDQSESVKAKRKAERYNDCFKIFR
ncbi:MAG: type IX secretion system membrane protein PorP/SprF [Saprospiraceae bacterium]|nr:type IX secretion system membrane protein PorP/SprF [Saprospiraceae bacterium]